MKSQGRMPRDVRGLSDVSTSPGHQALRGAPEAKRKACSVSSPCLREGRALPMPPLRASASRTVREDVAVASDAQRSVTVAEGDACGVVGGVPPCPTGPLSRDLRPAAAGADVVRRFDTFPSDSKRAHEAFVVTAAALLPKYP